MPIKNDKSSYPIVITGDNFGSTLANQTVSVSATVDGVALDPPHSVSPHKIEFEIPARLVAGKFDDNTIKTLPLDLTVTRTQPLLLNLIKPKITILQHEIRLALLPDYIGTLKITTERPTYDWVSESPLVDSSVLTGPYPFIFGPVAGASAKAPQEGNQKFGRDIVASCGKVGAAKRKAWKLQTNELVLESDPLIMNGWSSSSYVGEPPGNDLAKFDQEALARLGWSPGFYQNNSCAKFTHCAISANQVKAHAKETTSEDEECPQMYLAEQNFKNQDSALEVWIRGTAPHQVMWSVKVPVFTYKQVGKDIKTSDVRVYAKHSDYFDVVDPKGAIISLNFFPSNDVPSDGHLPDVSPKGVSIDAPIK